MLQRASIHGPPAVASCVPGSPQWRIAQGTEAYARLRGREAQSESYRSAGMNAAITRVVSPVGSFRHATETSTTSRVGPTPTGATPAAVTRDALDVLRG